MELIDYIKSQIAVDSIVGTLAQDIQGDNEFPVGKTEEEIISYLEFKTRRGGTHEAFSELMGEYRKHKNIPLDELDVEAKYGLLRAENWIFYKSNFPVDKVILVGEPQDIYKVYCVDSTSKKALYFNIKSKYNLNDIQIVESERIQNGNLTTHTTVSEALGLLQACDYDVSRKPNEANFKELIEFLRSNN